uniref:Beta-mannosidase n=1 Tax=Acrobeloides nanus TaxID=290746 RepID=A0A914EGZ7_9BILA
MKEANMNVMRLWGGGLYELDEFYEMTDEAGIMIWHDHMFACSLYDADDNFMDLVRPEFANQVIRLRHHSSILVWAGNNENELFLGWGWFNTNGYNQTQMIADYLKLFDNVMKSIVTQLDPSRPFVPSSPSNGKNSEDQGGVALKPDANSWMYGDVHYYTYSGDLWKPSAFPIPRCATEYGSQSIPLTTTMARYVPPDEWTSGSSWMKWRDHQGNGNVNNLALTFPHFEVKYTSAKNITLDDNDGFVVRAILQNQTGIAITPTVILLPDKMRQITNPNYGDATITNVQKVPNTCTQSTGCPVATFTVTLSATKLVPILWLDIKAEVKERYQILYWFSDNGFTMTQPQVSVDLQIFATNDSTLTLTTQDLTVWRAKMSQAGFCPDNWYQPNTNTRKCIKIVNETRTWAQGEAMCQSYSSDLISITNAFENSDLTAYIKTNAPGCQKAYIGLYENNSSWAWVNGDNSTYRNWAPGNPTNDPNSSCALIDQNSGTWLNQDCNTPQCYICAISLN